MSIYIHMDNLSVTDEEKIIKEVRVKKVENSYNPRTGFKVKETYLNAFQQYNELNCYYVPFSW